MHLFKQTTITGQPLATAQRALVLIHGRGASAGDILPLAKHLPVADYALLAPNATGGAWYPYSFMAPVGQNEPALSSALDLLENLVAHIEAAGIAPENIWLLGFSQGACLTLEFATRHAQRWGGVVAFTGGLIGAELNLANYHGDFAGTPVYIGIGDRDQHVPLQRAQDTATVLTNMGAQVTLQVFPGRAHVVSMAEVEWVQEHIF